MNIHLKILLTSLIEVAPGTVTGGLLASAYHGPWWENVPLLIVSAAMVGVWYGAVVIAWRWVAVTLGIFLTILLINEAYVHLLSGA